MDLETRVERPKLTGVGVLLMVGVVLMWQLGAVKPHAIYGQEKPSKIARKGPQATKGDVGREAKRQQKLVQEKKLFPPELLMVRQVMDICCSSPVPDGWIKVNDYWSPTSCGNPGMIIYNVCIIEKYSDKTIGAVMNVCSSAKTPTGWVDVEKYWAPNSCGHPGMIINNMKQIKRVS